MVTFAIVFHLELIFFKKKYEYQLLSANSLIVLIRMMKTDTNVMVPFNSISLRTKLQRNVMNINHFQPIVSL